MNLTPVLNDLLDDLTPLQYRLMLDYLWIRGYKVTRGSIKEFRKTQGLSNEDE